MRCTFCLPSAPPTGSACPAIAPPPPPSALPAAVPPAPLPASASRAQGRSCPSGAAPPRATVPWPCPTGRTTKAAAPPRPPPPRPAELPSQQATQPSGRVSASHGAGGPCPSSSPPPRAPRKGAEPQSTGWIRLASPADAAWVGRCGLQRAAPLPQLRAPTARRRTPARARAHAPRVGRARAAAAACRTRV